MVTRDELDQIAKQAMQAGARLRRDMERIRYSRELLECDHCGHRATGARIENDPAYSKCVSAGFNVHGPGDGEPPEWVTVCPNCGTEEAIFDPVTVCSECDDYPCTCGA